ncbi:GntR family transcriptional regulator [Yoonia sp. BS5-3]|uniref:GntR family transcriptional regulator n=1 Tax=Yoonia phaeophyticola TaxID=3137369 RepID=A0ABZ2V548_9RHOB
MTKSNWTDELKDFADLKPRRSLAMEAADTLREFILLGKLAPGVPVRERDLADAFGISRTPLKEALRILEGEGLIDYGPTRRPRVADPSLVQILDWLRVQGALEGLGGELCCQLATEHEIKNIAALNAAIVKARDAGNALEAFRKDMAFHAAIVAASRNAALIETHTTYNARLWRVRYLSSQRSVGIETTKQQHLDIVAALETRDAVAARKALRTHLQTAEINIAAVLADDTPAS